MKNRILTNSIRNIKKSFARFISLMVMSLLGVFAFSGLQATAPDMVETLNRYLNEHHTYDIKIVSTLGCSDEDINALKHIKGMDNVEGSYSKDTLAWIDDIEYVLNVSSMPSSLNTLSVLDGRLCENGDEIVVEKTLMNAKKLKIGDWIALDDPVFIKKKVKIVGVVDSALYYNFVGTSGGRGSTSVGSGTIHYYAYCHPSNFDQDYYSAIYCSIQDITQFTTASKEYTDSVSEIMDSIENIKEAQQNARYDSIIQNGENEIQKEKQEADKKLKDASLELEKALNTLNNAKDTLDSSYPKLISLKNELENAWITLSNAKDTLEVSKNGLQEYKRILDENKSVLDSSFVSLNDAKQELDENQRQIDEAKEEISLTLGIPYDSIQDAYQAALFGIDHYEDILNVIENYEEYKNQLDDLIHSGDYSEEFVQRYDELMEIISSYEQQLPDISKEDIEAYLQQYQEQIDKIEEIFGIVDQIENSQKELDRYKEEYNNKYSLYESSLQTYNDAYLDYLNKENQYNQGMSVYTSSLNQYNQGYGQYIDGLRAYNQGQESYREGMNQYNASLKEYEDAKKELDEKIEDAYDTLHSVSKPKWFIYDRTNYSTYTDYIDDTNSISNLAGIFPVVFYAVAILVSLISMNRMVEDDRLEIGTLKSLGFSNGYILCKYLLFSSSATICGGLIGAILGITYLPYMISNIYTILFDLPDLVYLPNVFTTALGILISIVCVCGASVYTALKELKEKPSELMRPKAPKQGKRILLENVFIWKKMSFSQKIIARNIFRYKKRVLVTIFGIAGCTALMLCGFGIKDSIVDIPTSQYGQIFTFDGYSYISDDTDLDTIFDDSHFSSVSKIEAIPTYVNNTKLNLFVCEDSDSLKEIVNLRDSSTKEIDTLKPGQIIITDKFAQLLNIKVHDTIECVDLNNKTYTLEVSDIVDNYVEHYGYIDKETFTSFKEDFSCNIVYFHMKEGINEEECKEYLLSFDQVVNVSFMSSLIDKVGDMLKSLDKVVWILIILSALLSFVVLYNLSNININERKREIATLKVLGFYDREVDNYITKENIILTFIGIVFGLIFGFFLTRIVVSTVEIEKCRFIYQIKGMSYILSSCMALLFTLIVNVVTHFTLKRIDMIESLKSVE